jgi:hypothetical protein
MKTYRRLLTILLLIYLVLSALSYSLWQFAGYGIPFQQTAVLLSASLVISALAGGIFVSGLKKPGSKRVLNTLVAISVKFFLFIVLLVAFVFITENRSWHLILTFFVIYLAFTSFLLTTFVSILKKS